VPPHGIAHLDGDVSVSIAASQEEMRIADHLVRKQYVSRGYHYQASEWHSSFADHRRRGLPILTWFRGRVVGTATLGIDSSAGLHVDEGNREHVDLARVGGQVVGEVVKLATSEGADSRRVLAALFGALHRLMVLHNLTDVFIEVNPRHVAFYRRALCFEVAGHEKICPRVGAPSVLLRMRVADLTDKIAALEFSLAQFPLN
jgi:hypothetical protein